MSFMRYFLLLALCFKTAQLSALDMLIEANPFRLFWGQTAFRSEWTLPQELAMGVEYEDVHSLETVETERLQSLSFDLSYYGEQLFGWSGRVFFLFGAGAELEQTGPEQAKGFVLKQQVGYRMFWGEHYTTALRFGIREKLLEQESKRGQNQIDNPKKQKQPLEPLFMLTCGLVLF